MLKLAAPSDLEDLALELGATAQHSDGRVFNASQRSGAVRLPAQKPRPPQETAPPEPVAAPAADPALMRLLAEVLARPAPEAHTPLPAQVIVQPAARSSWEFEFKRNTDGTIRSITANPV